MSIQLSLKSSVGVVVPQNPWLILTNSSLTTAEKKAAKDAEEDLLLANHYFERIGRRVRIHEFAVQRHLKAPTKTSLSLVISTWDDLERAQMQTPPPLDTAVDVKAAIARGRRLAFGEESSEAEHAWAYNPTSTENTGVGPIGHMQGETVEHAWVSAADNSSVADSDECEGAAYTTVEEAELALEQIQAIARRVRPEHRCPYSLD